MSDIIHHIELQREELRHLVTILVYIGLITGCILVIASVATIVKIHKTSKAVLAYTLMLFTLLQAVNIILIQSVNQTELNGKVNTHVQNVVRSIGNWVIAIMPMQGWLFASKYFQSSLQFFTTKPIFMYVRIAVCVIWAIIVLTCLIWLSLLYASINSVNLIL
jgi:uncharacterized membrane protein YsdA (DUF1294 family)